MKNIQIKNISILVVLFALYFSFNPNTATAQLVNPPDSPGYSALGSIQTMLDGEKKLIDIDGDSYNDILVEVMDIDLVTGRPTIKTTSLAPSAEGGSQYVESNFIGQYITAMYKYAIIIITLLSVIMIIFAGVQWTMSGGSPDKINSSKQIIARSLTGLAIALGSYTLLFTINPDLVAFKNLQVLRVTAIAEIPEDRILPVGIPAEPLADLMTLTSFIDNQVNFLPGVDKRATAATKAAFESALNDFSDDPNNKGVNVDVIVSTAYRSPDSQYSLMIEKCGCETIEQLFSDEKNKNIPLVKDTDQWTSHCTKIAGCTIGHKSLIVKDGIFQAPQLSHFAGNALDISVVLTGAVKPCGDISIDDISAKSKGVVNAGQWKKDWCVPKQQQLLIKAMIKNGFCVGIKDGSTLREPWHFELKSSSAGVQDNFCTNSIQDANMAKLEYLTLQ